MKKFLSFFAFVSIVLALPFNFVFAQKYFGEREKVQIKYRKELGVKKYSLTVYPYEYGVPSNRGQKIREISYDDNYNVISSILFDDGEFDGKITYKYNESNDTLEIKKYNDDNELEDKTVFVYGKDGKLKEKKYFHYGKLENRDVYSYLPGGKVEIKSLAPEELDYRIVYEYDDAGRELVWTKYDDENNILSKSQCKYDRDGRKTDSIVYWKGDPETVVKWKYYDDGKLKEKGVFEGDGALVERTTFEYDEENGLLSKEKKYDDQNVMVEEYEIIYRDEDKQAKQINRYGEGEFLQDIWRFEYYGNGLLKQEIYLNSLEVPKFLRKYEYEPNPIKDEDEE